MKRLFLASILANTASLLNKLIKTDPQKCKTIFITTAADPYEDKWWMEADIEAMQKCGYPVSRYDIKNKTVTQLRHNLKIAQIICVGGGNTFYLLDQCQKTGFNDVIRELVAAGVVYVGSSAGSVLATPTIESVRGADDPSLTPKLKSYAGLSLVPFAIIPHSDEPKYKKEFDERIQSWKEPCPLMLLTDHQALVVEDKTLRIIDTASKT